VVGVDESVCARYAVRWEAVGLATLIIDYAIQLTFIQPALLVGETEDLSPWTQYNPHGIFIAMENGGYVLGPAAADMARRPTSPASAAPVIASVLGGWLLGTVLRRTSVRSGVSDAEAYGSLPGDEVIPHPMVEWTRGVTVRTTPERVWPWLAQMGYGRGGWYTPELVDLFANRWVFGVKRRFPKSADRLLPKYQQVDVGDLICDGPEYASYFRVQHVDPPHALVYRSIRHPRRGSPIDITDPESPDRVERQLRDAGTYIDFTWALALNGLPRHRTRLLVRTRANWAPSALGFLSTPLGLVDASYGVAMLRAIARRAESIDSVAP